MSFIDLVHDKDREVISVVERDKNGMRQVQEYPANYTLYYEDPKGKFRSLSGTHLSKFSTRKRAEWEREKRIHNKKLHESDISPASRCLSEHYRNAEAPKLHTCFFDIEVAIDTEKGFSSPEEALNKVTAITVYLDWTDQLITLVIAPDHMSEITAREIVAEFENTILFTDERQMFEVFFELIEDADVLSGWNSEGYDIPYLVNRCTQILSKADTRRFCLLGQLPKVRKYERFGKEETTYDLIGRIHLDYLQLYKKFNYEGRHSYKLDAIAELELGERKTQYEGTLDQLYNQDFKKFIVYNRQDTMLVYKIHHKLQFLELANQMAHENTVLIPTVMGTVALVEMAVMNEAHDHGLIVPDKQRSTGDEQIPAAGAYVATPKKGINEWVGAVDINSLYPSTIRALNMAPETIVGQLRPTLTDQYMRDKGARLAREKKQFKEGDDDVGGAVLWEGLFGSLEYTAVMNQEPGTMITLDYEDGQAVEMSAADIWKLVFSDTKQWMISANGTIFSYAKEGIIPGLLSKWYSDRKVMQKKMREATTKEDKEYWDKRQLVRKILLNSAYGALLNQHCRFFDKRLGQSVTLCGRQIVRHMSAQINETITGEYDYTGKSIVYGDTDSCYFSAWPIIRPDVEAKTMEWNKDIAVQLYDTIADSANDSFPAFMEKSFHAPRRQGEIIKAGRELVADRSLFITKKRYAVNIYDKEGKRLDADGKTGKIKAMGLDLKRSDTPKYIQTFLMDILEMVLGGRSKDEIITHVREYKEWMATQDPWTKGSPKSVNKLTMYAAQEAHSKTGRVPMPGHVRGSLNWNTLRRLHNDNYSMKIVDGSRISVCRLRGNPMNYTSVAYPVDETRLPQWFKDLPFDVETMEETLIDDKLENLLGVLGWDLRQDTAKTNVNDFFTFG